MIWQHKIKALLAKQTKKKKKNFSLSETTILTLSVNHKEPKHISYGYEIFQTKKVR